MGRKKRSISRKSSSSVRGGRYTHVGDDWVWPVRRGFKLACCDCGLVHLIDFKIAKGARRKLFIGMKFDRDERATAAMRRPFKFSKED